MTDPRPPQGPLPVPLGARPRVSRRFRLQYEQAQKAWVLLYPEGMVKLNTSAGEILQRCDGERTVAQIVALLEEAFDASDLEGDVLGFLAIALQQHWVDIPTAERAPAASDPPDGSSARS